MMPVRVGSATSKESPVRIALAMIAVLLSVAGCRQEPAAAAPNTAPAPAGTASASETDAPVAPAAPTADDAIDAVPAGATANAPEPDDHAAVNAAIDNVLGDHAPYERAITGLRAAIKAGDRDAVAALVAYPFTTRVDGKATKVADATAFVARYDDIVTPAIARVIGEQRYADLFVNQRGVMFGNGEAWINGVCADASCAHPDVRVVAIQPAQ